MYRTFGCVRVAVGGKHHETRPPQLAESKSDVERINRKIREGTENRLLASRVDLPIASANLNRWWTDRERLQYEIAGMERGGKSSSELDPDAVIAELDHLEEHLTSESTPLARDAFQRVFESVTLFWEPVSPRRRELKRAEIKAKHPFV